MKFIWTLLLLSVFVLANQTAHAQVTIPNSVTQVSGSPTATEQQQIINFVRHWRDQLIEGESAQVGTARRELVAPLSGNGSMFFKRAYSDVLSSQIKRAMDSPELHVRLNTAIAAAELMDQGAFDVIEQGLKDENPGVRYWSAKALVEVVIRRRNSNANDALPNDPQRMAQLLKVLKDSGRSERDSRVLTEILKAGVVIQTPESQVIVLEELNTRLNAFAADPSLSQDMILSTLPPLYAFLLTETDIVLPEDLGENKRPIRKVAQVSYRYLLLGTLLQDQGSLSPSESRAYKQLMESMLDILNWSAGKLGHAEAAMLSKEDTERQIRQEQWPELLNTMNQWELLLIGPPTEFPTAELVVKLQE